MTTKANPDYSKSAVNLCNPPEVKALLDVLHGLESQNKACIECFELAVQANPELKQLSDNIAHSEGMVNETREHLESAIKEYGSYQDIEAGHYAVLQARNKREYDPLPIQEAEPDTPYGQAASLVLDIVIDVKRLENLIRGGILDEQELIEDGVIKLVPMAPAIIIK